MKKLSSQAFERARTFIKTQARPVDRRLFEVRFEDAPVRPCLEELSRYRNDDGGFGRALEPDMRAPSSSALATGIALRTLKELGAGADHPLVGGAIHYLLDTFDPVSHTWRVIPEEANEHPHAPWWHEDGQGSLARIFDNFLIIPRAELVGLLHHYAAAVPAGWLTDVTERCVAAIEKEESLGAGGGDDVVYVQYLAETEALPERFRQRLRPLLRAVVPRVISRDPAAWASYSVHPLKVAPRPESTAADLIAGEVQANLDYQIEHQTDEGTWEPNWTWSGLYPEAWEQARQEWRGHLTLETLTSLRAYGRLDA